MVSPTAAREIPNINDIDHLDPIEEYGNDYYTVPSSICGAPATCIPGKTLGTSLKVWGKYGDDIKLLKISESID